MVKTISILVIFFLFVQGIFSQTGEFSSKYDNVYNNYNYAFEKIEKGLSQVKYCFSIKDARQLRTQILYACTEPASSRKNIDEAINNVYLIEQILKNKNCPLASSYAKYAREKFESAISELQLGFLSFMAASERRNIKSIYSDMNRGLPHWNRSLNKLNSAIEFLNKSLTEFQSCFEAESKANQVTDSCDIIIEQMEKEYKLSKYIPSLNLNSSWLFGVGMYEIKGTLFVIAEIDRNDDSVPRKRYLFCNISKENWSSFINPSMDTYGERFHKYIFDYKCNCD